MPANPDVARPETPVAMFLLPVLGAVFGANAFQVGKEVICTRQWLAAPDKACGEPAGTEGGLIAIGIGLFILVAAGAITTLRTGKPANVFVATVVTSLVSAVLAVVKETSPDHHPTAETGIGLFYFAIAAMLFVVPILFLPPTQDRWDNVARLYGRLTIAGVIGALVSGAIQCTVAMLPHEWFANGGTSLGPFAEQQAGFFIAAPMAAGTLMGPWSLVTFDPLLRREVWSARHGAPGRLIWICAYLACALALPCTYALAIYDRKPLSDADVSMAETAIAFMLVILPGFAAVLLGTMLGWFGRSSLGARASSPKPLLKISLAALCFGALGAGLVAFRLFGRTNLTSTEVPIFVIAHASTAVTAAVSAYLGHKIKLGPIAAISSAG